MPFCHFELPLEQKKHTHTRRQYQNCPSVIYLEGTQMPEKSHAYSIINISSSRYIEFVFTGNVLVIGSINIHHFLIVFQLFYEKPLNHHSSCSWKNRSHNLKHIFLFIAWIASEIVYLTLFLCFRDLYTNTKVTEEYPNLWGIKKFINWIRIVKSFFFFSSEWQK